MRTRIIIMAAALPLVGCAAAQPSDEDGGTSEAASAAGPSVRAIGQAVQPAASTSPPLTDHGGSVLTASKTYAIYGDPPRTSPATFRRGWLPC
jgi:hypothetical protein